MEDLVCVRAFVYNCIYLNYSFKKVLRGTGLGLFFLLELLLELEPFEWLLFSDDTLLAGEELLSAFFSGVLFSKERTELKSFES